MTMTTASLFDRAHDGAMGELDPAERPRRRSFTAEYQAPIVDEYDALPRGSTERGAFLRREGLYTSHIAQGRRLANLPQMLLHPFVVFAMAVLIMSGIAFSSIGNLGVLTRQRSLVVPFLLLPLCLPPRPPQGVPSYEAPRVAAYERVS
jgi:hypothetical protein